MATRIIYDRALLDEILLRDGATLIGSYEKLNSEVIINFKCKCGNEHQKGFRTCFTNGGLFCKTCVENNRQNKRKNTNLIKYGVENCLQSKEIQEKAKLTNLRKLGVQFPSQSKVVLDKRVKTYLEKYGVENPLQSEEIRDKSKQTNLRKYGVKNPLQSNEIKDKIKKTNLMKFGVKNPGQANEIKEKIKKTNLERYGIENGHSNNIKDKIKKTNLEKYGVEFPFQSIQVKDKIRVTNILRYGTENPFASDTIKSRIKKTNLEKYGVEYPSQNEEIFAKAQKNAKKFKDFTMPSGAIRKVQGYEPFALRDLLAAGITEDQIKTERKEVPRIKYSVEEKDRYYFPDIFIPHQNRLIEVKSTWTYKCKTDFVKQKGEAAKAAGYNYELWIYDGKGNRVTCENEEKKPTNEIIKPNLQ